MSPGTSPLSDGTKRESSVPPGQAACGGLALSPRWDKQWVGRLVVLGDQGQRRGRPKSDFRGTETAHFPSLTSVPRLCRGMDTMPSYGAVVSGMGSRMLRLLGTGLEHTGLAAAPSLGPAMPP